MTGLTAFVLGGGGMLGAAEAGMLQALAAHGIEPDLVVGTSVGAINGAAYACGPGPESAARLAAMWAALGSSDVFGGGLVSRLGTLARTRTHLHDNDALRVLLDAHLTVARFEDLAVPFHCVAACIERASAHWFTTGPLVEAVLASCAVPGLLPAVRIGGEHFFDGGLVDSLPVGRAVALGATEIYALHVGRLEHPLSPPQWPWELAAVAFEIARRSRFTEAMAALPSGVRVHVLPTGTDRTPLVDLRYRSNRGVHGRIQRAQAATTAYLQKIVTFVRHLTRRVLGTPLIVLVAVLTLVVLPIVAALQAFSALGYLVGRPPRWRALRVAAFAVLYSVGECVCLIACLGVWLVSPVARWRDPIRWRDRHVRVLRCLLTALVRGAEWLFRFRLRLESPRGQTLDSERPLLVLGRHAGPGASFVLVHVLLERYARVPRIVLKRRLRLDPALDVLLTRIGCVFIGGGGSTRAIADLASRLDPRDALVIFPEGADWTPTRHRLAVYRLRLRGSRARADAAAARPHVLPPRPGGTFAALTAAPDAEIAVFMHTGHDDLLEAGSLWAALPLHRELHMVWWSEPRPPVIDEAGAGRWLDRVWTDIDSWVDEQEVLHRATTA